MVYHEQVEEEDSKIKQSDIIQLTHGVLPPTNNDMLQFKMPVGLVVQPQRDEEMPIVDFNSDLRVNPPRCQNCKAFVNCYSRFTPDGRHVCPLCNVETQLDFEYERMMRSDDLRAKRPELQSESYEIIAPDIYRVRRQESFETLTFLIDISPQALASGLVKKSAEIILKKLKILQQEPQRVMVSILLFNTQLHFCVFRNNLSFELYTVPDTEEPYIPAPRDVIVALKSRGEPVFALLENLEQIAKSIPAIPSSKKSLSHSTNDVCFYCAVEAAYKCM